MTTTHRTVVFHTFRGARFEDHGVDLDVLEDLQRYRDLLVEVAKELWRRNNPARERLPRNFEDSLSLRFYEVQPNCATIPLERIIPGEEVNSLFVDENSWVEDELDQAAELITSTVDAVGRQQSIPAEFPKRLLGMFESYGKTLRTGEWFEHRPARASASVRYDGTVREGLMRAMNASYESFVDITGAVTMARVTRPRMAIQLDDEREIEASFQSEDEEKITTALKQHTVTKVRVVGRGTFAPEGRLLRINQVDRVDLLPGGELPFDASAKPIWDVFDDILADVPREELESLPRDGAQNLDHYLYGTPRTGS